MRDTRPPTPEVADRLGQSNHFVAIVACWPIVGPSIVLLANTLVPRAGPVSLPLGTVLAYGLLGLALAGSLHAVVGRLTPAVLGIMSCLLLAFAALIVLDQDWADYHVAVAIASLGFAVPWMLVANAVTSQGQFLRYLYVAAIAIVLAGALRLFFPVPGSGHAAYSQYAGYQMLPAVVIFADDVLHRRKLLSAALLAVSVVLLLAAGARGPFLALILYLLARSAVALRRRPSIVAMLLAAGLIFTQWFVVIGPAILSSSARIFTAHGLSTRTLDRLIAGEFLEDRKRTALAGYTWDLIFKHPGTGVGVARDRPLLANAMGEHDPLLFQAWYPHNIFLELLAQWGLFVGGGLILAVSVMVLRAVLRDSDGLRQRVVLIFVGIGLWPLLVSGSYLTSPLFFALLGFCLASGRQARLIESKPKRKAARAD